MDSLTKQLKTQPEDTGRAHMLLTLGWETSYNSLIQGLLLCEEGLDLAQRLKSPALIAYGWNNIGTIYEDLGDYPKALDAHHKSIHLRDSLNDPKGLCASYINISLVYKSLDSLHQALDYLMRSHEIAIKNNYYGAISESCIDIGQAYLALDSVDRALSFFQEGLRVTMSNNFHVKQAYSLAGVAQCYALKDQQDDADRSISMALDLMRQYGGEYDRIGVFMTLGEIRKAQKKYEDSRTAFDSAIVLSTKLGVRDMQREAFMSIANVYELQGDKDKALEFYKRYVQLHDSLINQNNSNRMTELDKFYQNARNQRLIENLKHDNEQQNFLIIGAAIAVVLLLALAFLLNNRAKMRQRTSNQLARQKAVIEEKNKEITDSINYAQKIQAALMPRPEDFEAMLRQGLVLFKPKDIVSGDFFWLAKKNNWTYWVTADCTGHGVPGGFMSMLGSSFLSEIVNERNITEPAEILNVLRERVVSALRQTGTAGETKDGMDMVLCRLDMDAMELCYAAANNSFYIIHENGVLDEYNPDKMPVGYHPEQKPFSQHTVKLLPGDMIYCFTDGFADQFGGAQGKKFKYRRFQELLISISGKFTNEQDHILEKTFEEWKGNNAQTDDVLVIGIRM